MMHDKKKGKLFPGKRTTGIFLLAIIFLISPPPMTAQGKKATLDNARDLVVTGEFDKAIAQYAGILKKDSMNVQVNAEYAYVLALDGIYDAALSRLDRIWNIRGNSPEVNFYASQVFALMGYDQLSEAFGKGQGGSSMPGWINQKASEFALKYKGRPYPESDTGAGDVVTEFRRANRLTAQNQNIRSVALFEEIIAQYPDEFLPYVGYSIALEKAGLNGEALQVIDKALALTGDKEEYKDARQMLEQRKTSITATGTTPATKQDIVTKVITKASSNSSKYTAYAGGMISGSYFSLNGRFGTYKPGFGSTSADLGIMRANGGTSIILGASTYFRQKIFVSGLGLTAGLGGGAIGLNMRLTVGVSIMNKAKTGSWDIFLDGQKPLLPKGGVTTVGMSIGRSVYFGKR